MLDCICFLIVEISQRVGGDMEWCVDALQEHVADSGAGFPCDIGL